MLFGNDDIVVVIGVGLVGSSIVLVLCKCGILVMLFGKVLELVDGVLGNC